MQLSPFYHVEILEKYVECLSALPYERHSQSETKMDDEKKLKRIDNVSFNRRWLSARCARAPDLQPKDGGAGLRVLARRRCGEGAH